MSWDGPLHPPLSRSAGHAGSGGGPSRLPRRTPTSPPTSSTFAWLGEPGSGPGDGGRLPCRNTNGRRPPVYIEPQEWNLLRFITELPYSVLLLEAERTIEAHRPKAHDGDDEPDPHGRWRNLRRATTTATTYVSQRCRACTDEGCARLDAAMEFYVYATVGPYVAKQRECDAA